MDRGIVKRRNWLVLLAGLVTAFGLRVYALGGQSLWNDEGTSVALSALNLQAIVDGAAKDIHVPLYYFLLHFWMPVAGRSEFAVRFLSVVAGTLVVAAAFRLARILYGVRVAQLALFLVALAPFQVYYSQEARMYIWVTLWSALSFLAMVRVLEMGSWKLDVGKTSTIHHSTANLQSPTSNFRLWLAYVACTIAALYSHYYGATIVIAENVAFAAWLAAVWLADRDVSRPRGAGTNAVSRFISSLTLLMPGNGHTDPGQEPRPLSRSALEPAGIPKGSGSSDPIARTLVKWIVSQCVIGGSFLPWYLATWTRISTWPATSDPFDLPTLVWRVLNAFSVGLSLETAAGTAVAVALGLVCLVGMRWGRTGQQTWATGLLVLWMVAPVALMYVVSLSRPSYNGKFLLLAAPPFLILSARGLAWLSPSAVVRRLWPAWHARLPNMALIALAAFAVVGFVPSLINYYFDPRYARDDYRTIVNSIDRNERAGDGILIDAPGQMDVVRYYHRGAQTFFPLPRMRPPLPDATRADVDDMLTKVRRLYAIYWATSQSDPQGIVETRLAERAFKASDEWHGDIRLAVYGVATATTNAQTSNARVGEDITLESYALARQARPADILTLTLNWTVPRTPAMRLKVFSHLIDGNGELVAQRDGEPVGDTRITTTWRPGETIPDNYGIMIPPGTAPGEYTLEIGMYRADDGTRLPITDRDGQASSDHLILGTVRITP